MPNAADRPQQSPADGLPLPAVITCAVLEQEVMAVVDGLADRPHVEVLEQGLHNDPPRLRVVLQDAIDRVEAATQAQRIALVYGLCSRGTEGVSARQAMLGMARAHDCITLLLGDRHRYAAYVAQHPGTYWYSPGWNRCHTPPGPERHETLRRRYVEQFGEDNADYLMESEQAWFSTYTRATWVSLPILQDPSGEAYTRRCADWLGWETDSVRGDTGLLTDLIRGRWDDERFIVLRPGERFRMTADHRVVEHHPESQP